MSKRTVHSRGIVVCGAQYLEAMRQLQAEHDAGRPAERNAGFVDHVISMEQWTRKSTLAANTAPTVTSSLLPGMMSFLPTRFPKSQNGERDRQMDKAQCYVRTWQRILTHMLGWSAERAREWVKRWEPLLSASDLFYHDAPNTTSRARLLHWRIMPRPDRR